MRDCSSKTCFDQFKQGALDILDEFVHGNWCPLPILFCPSLTSGLILGSCETHNRSVGSVVNTNVDFDSVALWHHTPPSGTLRTLPQPFSLTHQSLAVMGSGSLDPLACNIPAILDKLFDIGGIESQRAPAGSHLNRRKVRSALARSVLDDPRNTHSQFVRHILRFDKLAYWRRFYPDDRQAASEVTSV